MTQPLLEFFALSVIMKPWLPNEIQHGRFSDPQLLFRTNVRMRHGSWYVYFSHRLKPHQNRVQYEAGSVSWLAQNTEYDPELQDYCAWLLLTVSLFSFFTVAFLFLFYLV